MNASPEAPSATAVGTEETSRPPNSARPPTYQIALYGVLSVAAILYLPYLFPVRPTASLSYLYGYNNKVAVLLALVLAAAGAIWTSGFGLKLRPVWPSNPSEKVAKNLLWACLATTTAGCLAMQLLAGPVNGLLETPYDVDRIWLLAHGRMPYRDFEWPFGVGLLYIPLWFSRLLHIGIASADELFWILLSLLGVILLYAIINLIDYPTVRRNQLFLLFYSASLFFVFIFSPHYTLPRYLLPEFFILIVFNSARRCLRTQTVLLALCFTVALFFLSPEMAIAHAFACMVLLFPYRCALNPAGISARSYGCMVAGLVAIFAAALRFHALDTLLTSGGGADSFPIPIALSILFFLGAIFVSACAIVRRARNTTVHGTHDNSIALIVLSVPLVAAALGRCDPMHVLFNGFGLFLIVGFYASASTFSWRLYSAGFSLCILVPLFLSLRGLLSLIPSVALHDVGEGGLPGHHAGAASELTQWVIHELPPSAFKNIEISKLNHAHLRVPPSVIDFRKVYAGVALPESDGVFEAPLGYKPNTFASYLSPDVDYGYYEGLENANTPRAIQQKISELAAHPDRSLLLGNEGADSCRKTIDQAEFIMHWMSLTPYRIRPAHLDNVHQPLCDYITEHYVLAAPASEANYQYELWTPRKTASASVQTF